jgi:hypothetical protein
MPDRAKKCTGQALAQSRAVNCRSERPEAGTLNDVTPWLLWPSRYNVNIDKDGNEIGVPNRGAPGRKAMVNDTDLSKTRNVKKRKAAWYELRK